MNFAHSVKNCLLAFLTILMFHFIIQNTIVDEIEKMHRLEVHKSLEQKYIKKTEIVLDDEVNIKTAPEVNIKTAPEVNIKTAPEVSIKDILSAVKDDNIRSNDCDNSITCSEMTKTDPNFKMEKELYDFIYNDDTANGDLERYYDETKTNEADEQKKISVDENNIDLHHESIKKIMNNNNDNCMFEVIGTIETDLNDISGLSSGLTDLQFFQICE